MSIWTYSHCLPEVEAIATAIEAPACIFCSTRLEVPRDEIYENMDGGGKLSSGTTTSRRVCVCPACGWWTVSEILTVKELLKLTRVKYGAAGALQQLDISDQSLPISKIRQYIAARYDARLEIHPRRFEEVVGSVYANLGYDTLVTGYSGDGGIDIILEGTNGQRLGVQVKRTKNAITVEQIRSLVGALYLRGLTRGVFVTTSSFPRGARLAARMAALRGTPVELVDASRFYDALRIVQRKLYESSSDPSAPFTAATLVELNSYRNWGHRS